MGGMVDDNTFPCIRYLCHPDMWRAMMSNRGGKTYRPWEPQRYRQEAHSPAAKLPEGDLVFFLIDTVSRLDLRRFYAPYEDETRGAPPFDPAMMVCLLLYAYCVGVFSSRKMALACERNLAFMAIVGQDRPDFRTISDFRKLHLEAFIDVFVAVGRLAGEAGLVKLGNVSTDGTKIQGNASKCSLRKSLIVRKSGRSWPTMAMKARLRSQASAILRLENTPTQYAYSNRQTIIPGSKGGAPRVSSS